MISLYCELNEFVFFFSEMTARLFWPLTSIIDNNNTLTFSNGTTTHEHEMCEMPNRWRRVLRLASSMEPKALFIQLKHQHRLDSCLWCCLLNFPFQKAYLQHRHFSVFTKATPLDSSHTPSNRYVSMFFKANLCDVLFSAHIELNVHRTMYVVHFNRWYKDSCIQSLYATILNHLRSIK